MTWSYGECSHVGRRRRRNEDALIVLPERGVFAVADGMGGHAGGDVASRLAVEALRGTVSGNGPLPTATARHALRAAFVEAGRALAAEVGRMPRFADMGTTLAAVHLDPASGIAIVAHVGDSRVYRLRDGRLELVTRDHTWVQQEVDAGRLTPEAARRHPRAAYLLRVLDARGSGEPDIAEIETQPGDTLLLCTDGLSGPVDDLDLAAILAQPLPPALLAEQLIGAANQRGGPDNITAIVVRRTD